MVEVPALTGAKAASFRPSSPVANSIVGLVQVPKSRARLVFWVEVAAGEEEEDDAAVYAFSCSSHCPTPPAREPEFAASAQALCWIAQERWRAAPGFRNVAPLTENGRSEAEEVTGGGGLPREPVKIWMLLTAPEEAAGVVAISVGDAELEADAGEADEVEALAKGALASASLIEAVAVLSPMLAETAAEVPFPAPEVAEFATAPSAAAGKELAGAATPATAASISAAVASSRSKFSVKIHPGSSSTVSQLLPLAVGSFTSPGANVPDLRASWGSPPIDAICFANSRVTALFFAAAPGEAGSYSEFIRVSSRN